MKNTNISIGPLILITTSLDVRAEEGTTSRLASHFDIATMETVLKKRLSSSIAVSDIETAFSEDREIPYAELETITKILYDKHETILEKAFLLQKIFKNTSHPVVKNKIIRNFGYLLFAKELWFSENTDLAQKIFPDQEFHELFFKKRIDSSLLFAKKHSVR